MYSESKCKLYLSKSVHLLLSIRAALEIHTALYCHHEGAKCQFRVRSWWALYMRRLFPPVMSLPMFIIPQYPAITLDGWSLAIINLQCWVLLHQLVNIPGKENIMYQSILNWTSQFARKKCSYYSMVAVVNYKLTVAFHSKSLQCFKSHPSPWLLPTSPKQRWRRYKNVILAELVKNFVSVCMRPIRVLLHPPRVVCSQQSMKPVVWAGVLTSHRQLCKGGFWTRPFIGPGWIPTLILVLEMKACTPEQWFWEGRAQVRGEQAAEEPWPQRLSWEWAVPVQVCVPAELREGCCAG